ncbi:hypothetical protein EOD41_20365 [Mucilaginibacter limnophilus]|uniref:Uncharacterized protein n=1 Tax=Mucilaginibacter limnophilus TaxID=1932778 RepID=A0A437MFM7_9SPHI|nr:hypothetical protein [Mucilaginibacter limnophilus]RVT96438.1 hypothetical protein EOD41_20365 [Mucilaginibacter limnophilus]
MDKQQRFIIAARVIGVAGFIVILYFFSPFRPFKCKTYAENFRDNYACNIVLLKKSKGGRSIEFKGYDPITKENIKFIDASAWLLEKYDLFIEGDTVVKIKGQYTTTIYRHNQTIPIYFECGGDIFYDND